MTPVISPETLPAKKPRGKLNWSHIIWWGVLTAGVLLAPFTFSWTGLFVCVGLYFLSGFGVSMGYHRLLTHRSYQTPRFVEYILTTMGTLANQGGPIQWVAVHRIHHQHSDEEGDPHSPRDGVWWAHLLWWMPHNPALDEKSKYEHYVGDLLKDPVHQFFQRHHVLVPLTLAATLYLVGELVFGVGLSWVIWGMCVRTTFLHHATWLVNSVGHLWGYRSYLTQDDSKNSWWVAIVSFGEGWHNNHHAFPRSARHGLRWWEVDITYWLIRMMSFTGLAKQVHVPGRILRPAAPVTQS